MILLVEDVGYTWHLLKEYLAGAELCEERVVWMKSADSALHLLNKMSHDGFPLPKFIFSDDTMPGVTGAELCQFLKRDKRYVSIPFVFVTGVVPKDAQKLLKKTGADGYISKEGYDKMEPELRSVLVRFGAISC